MDLKKFYKRLLKLIPVVKLEIDMVKNLSKKLGQPKLSKNMLIGLQRE
jgi:hypothetical protein